MEQLPRSPYRRRNKHSRWSLPENHASTWMQRASNQQRYRAKTLHNSEASIREAPSENISLAKPTNTNSRRLGWPRTLSPLTAVKPNDSLNPTLRQLQQSEFKLPKPSKPAARQRAGASSTSAPKNPLLALPLHPIIASTSSSSGSSSASSPLPDTMPSAATLSAHSLFFDLSPTTLRRGRLSPLKPMSGSRSHIAGLVATPKQQPQLPFVCPLSPKPRPANPSKSARNPSPYAARQHQRHKKKRMAARPSGKALTESEPTAAVNDQAQSALQNNADSQQLSPHPPGLNIPQITIRLATPVPIKSTTDQCSKFNVPAIAIREATPLPGQEAEGAEPLANLCEQFLFRAELAEELEELNNDLHHLTSEP